MASNKFHIPLPSPQITPPRSSSRPSMDRRLSTLTPSTVTPPSLTTHTSSVQRTERTQTSPDRASALLARVASNPTSRVNSPLPSPAFDRSPDSQRSYASLSSSNAEVTQKTELSGNVSSYSQRDGYISFPDFERYRQGCEAGSGGQDHRNIKT